MATDRPAAGAHPERAEGKHLHGVPDSALKVVGKPWRKIDARARVTGQTRYADDLSMPRMAYCKLLRSTKAHARIISIDASEAEAMEGVHAVLLGKELPEPVGQATANPHVDGAPAELLDRCEPSRPAH